MIRINLDATVPAVKEFFRRLPLSPDGVELELEGQVVCTVSPPFSKAEKNALIERGRELVRRARERNKNVPSAVLQREVEEAVAQVRLRRSH
jgi:hypothetical protein